MNFNIGKGGSLQVVLVNNETKSIESNNELFSYLKEKEVFEGEFLQTYLDLNPNGDSTLFVGLGEEEKLTIDKIRKVFHKVGKEAMDAKIDSLGVNLPILNDLCYFKTVNAATEGLLQSESVFDKYLTEKKVKPTVKDVFFQVVEEKKEDAVEGIEEAKIVYEGIELTRALVNERAINMYPEVLANIAKEELEPAGVKVEIFTRKEIEDMKMEAFLAVSEGSDKEPRFIVMTYEGDPSSDEKIALVGKGLTYDSGGYSLKPSPSMDTMYTDMAGSATVIGSLKSIANAKLKKNVVGIVAACENLVDGKAYKPGDIIGSMSGKTIEVLNTDAEGRLTLADALWYAATEVKADKIIDLATLTGACIVALGEITTAAITNDNDLLEEVLHASEVSGEPIWQLPTNDDYRDMVKSKFADLVNTNAGGAKGAGTITAGLFLENFVKDTPWIHLDIAGTSYSGAARGYMPAGATGVHVKTLFNFIKRA